MEPSVTSKAKTTFIYTLLFLAIGCKHTPNSENRETLSTDASNRAPEVAAAAKPTIKKTKPFQAIWVTRWDYRTREDLVTIFTNLASIGISDVLFQIRGQADAFYRSRLEPWGQELLEDLPEGKTKPDFDPLATACHLAHINNMRLHAWINVMPLWKGKEPPKDKSHIFYKHKKWRLSNSKGQIQPLNEHYIIVNPVLPAVHRYLNIVVSDIVSRYPVDGIHLDYIRFVSENFENKNSYPHDPISRKLFTKQTGITYSEEKREQYRNFIQNRITALVRSLNATAKNARPAIVFSAAVWRDPAIGRNDYLQDWATWLKEGLLDIAFPMIYTEDNELFRDNLRKGIAVKKNASIIPGIGIYKHHNTDKTQEQIKISRESGADGLALFAYESMFGTNMPNQDNSEDAKRMRSKRLAFWKAFNGTIQEQ